MYGQIITFLFVLLILYYAAMIFLDLQKAKADKAAELEKNKEEVIDISDEAGQFQPVMITRDEPKKKNTEPNESADKEAPDSTSEKKDEIAQQVEPKEDNPITENSDHKSKNLENPDKSVVSAKPQKIYYHDENAMPKAAPISTAPKAEKDSETDLQLDTQSQTRKPNYRAPIMTDGYNIPDLLNKVDQLAESADGPLANVIYKARNPS